MKINSFQIRKSRRNSVNSAKKKERKKKPNQILFFYSIHLEQIKQKKSINQSNKKTKHSSHFTQKLEYLNLVSMHTITYHPSQSNIIIFLSQRKANFICIYFEKEP